MEDLHEIWLYDMNNMFWVMAEAEGEVGIP